jgi:hypothetical protein
MRYYCFSYVIILVESRTIGQKAEDYASIFGRLNLTSIRENVGEILNFIGRDGIFREYMLGNHGEMPSDQRARMREQLITAMGEEGEGLLPKLTIPFNRRFGDTSRAGVRGSHFFSGQ